MAAKYLREWCTYRDRLVKSKTIPQHPSTVVALGESGGPPPSKKRKTEDFQTSASAVESAKDIKEIPIPMTVFKPELMKAWNFITSLDKTGLFAAPVSSLIYLCTNNLFRR